MRYIFSLALKVMPFLIKSLENPSFAKIWGVLWPFISVLLLIAYMFKPGPSEIKIPQIVKIDGKPVTIIKTRPVTIKVLSGWIPIVSSDGNLRVDKFGFRLIPKIGYAYSGESEPVIGARWFVVNRFGLQSLFGKSKFYPIGIDTALPIINQVTFDLGVATKWDAWSPGAYGSLTVLLN